MGLLSLLLVAVGIDNFFDPAGPRWMALVQMFFAGALLDAAITKLIRRWE